MPTPYFGIDFAKDGYGVLDDVTTYLRGNVSVSYGRDQTTALAPVAAGQGAVDLDNASRRFSPRNVSSPLYGLIKPGRPVLYQETWSGVVYTIFAGHTDDQPINPDVDSKRVSVGLVDWLADFRRATVSTPLYASVRTGTAVGLVLDAVGWTGGRDLDPGATVIPWWWEDGDAWSALQRIVASEGYPALLTVGSSGEIVFRDRHHRITYAASTTSQGTWRGSGVEPLMNKPFSYNEGWGNVVNYADLTVDMRAPTDTTVVWSSQQPVSLLDGQTLPVKASGSDPFMQAITPDTTTDIAVVSGVVSVQLTRDSGGSTTILLTASGGPAQISSMQLRATPVPVAYSAGISAADTPSTFDYGIRAIPDLGWAAPYDAQAIADTTVAARAQPLPILSVAFQLAGPTAAAKAAAVLPRDLSDRVTVVEAETVLNADFYIEAIGHEVVFVGPSTSDHKVTFGLEAAPTPTSNPFRFDTAGAGFNDGLFDNGLPNAATVFRFDGTSGHRFDEGLFAA